MPPANGGDGSGGGIQMTSSLVADLGGVNCLSARIRVRLQILCRGCMMFTN
jgi:hypothetical protein